VYLFTNDIICILIISRLSQHVTHSQFTASLEMGSHGIYTGPHYVHFYSVHIVLSCVTRTVPCPVVGTRQYNVITFMSIIYTDESNAPLFYRSSHILCVVLM